MPAVEVSDLNQKAVLWANNGTDDYGDPKIGAPVEISVNWSWNEDAQESPTGGPVAIVGTVAVDRRIKLKSLLWLGRLAELPETKADLCQVIGYSEVPDVKGRNPRRSVTIARYSNTLPTIG
jgi:hypothetical protein